MSELHIIGEHAERTARWTARSAKLPSPPGVVLRVLRLLEDERTPLAEIKALIAADPALSARLLAYANSAPIRRAGPYVSTIDRAVRALGTRNLYRMLTTLSAQALRIESVPGYGMDEHALWRQSLRAAVAAEELARYVPEVDWSEAYMAGLLLDVGKLIVGPELRVRGDEIKAIMEASPDTPFDAIERRLFGADHARVGADLARTWRLAAPLQEAIRFHHMPARARAHREQIRLPPRRLRGDGRVDPPLDRRDGLRGRRRVARRSTPAGRSAARAADRCGRTCRVHRVTTGRLRGPA